MDKRAIADSFSRAAATYDDAAIAQRLMARRLTAVLPTGAQLAVVAADLPHETPAIIDLGCGTGAMTRRLLDRFSGWRVRGVDLSPGMVDFCRRRWANDPRADFVVGDAETYRPDTPAALVVSNCTFQWLADQEATLRSIRDYLAPGGWFALGAMLDGSLDELAQCYRQVAGRPMPGLDLWDEARYRTAFERAGLRLMPSSHVETLVVEHNHPFDVMRSLKEVGAHMGRTAGRPLTPAEMGRLAHCYRERYTESNGRVRSTWRAFLILAERHP